MFKRELARRKQDCLGGTEMDPNRRIFTGLHFMSCESALILVGQTYDDFPIYECGIHHEIYELRNGQYKEIGEAD